MPAAPLAPVERSANAVIRTERQVANHSPFLVRSEIMRPVGPKSMPKCPSYLGIAGREIWDSMIMDMGHNKYINTLVAQLELYVQTYLKWKQVRTRIEREGFLIRKTDSRGNTHSQFHPSYEAFIALQKLVNTQYKVIFQTMANTKGDVPFTQKLEAVAERVESQSSRGDLIGGDRMAA